MPFTQVDNIKEKFLRFAATPLLIVCFLLQTLGKCIVLFNYQVNKKYYAEVLCSNKGLVILDCEGKCQLVKDLEAHEKSQRATHFSKDIFDTQLTPPEPILLLGTLKLISHHCSRFIDPVSQGYYFEIFSPPKAT